MFEEIILGIIMEKDMTGYDIKKVMEYSFVFFYKASYGSLYPALKRMVKKGYLTSYEEFQGGRKKIFYHITEEGKKIFFEWLTTPMEVLDGSNSNLAKVYFLGHLSEEERERQLSIYEKKNEEYLNELQKLELELQQYGDMDYFYYQLSTLYYGIGVTKKTIEWCRHIANHKKLKDFD